MSHLTFRNHVRTNFANPISYVIDHFLNYDIFLHIHKHREYLMYFILFYLDIFIFVVIL